MSGKRTLVIGASENPYRYSHLAVERLLANGYDVIAIGKTKGKIGDVPIYDEPFLTANIHTVSLYLSPENQKSYYDLILSLKPLRIIFNPGAENPDFFALVTQNGVKALNACTLVMLNTGQF